MGQRTRKTESRSSQELDQTGGTAEMDAAEAWKLLEMMEHLSLEQIGEELGSARMVFINDLRKLKKNSPVTGAVIFVTARQLFYLRDVKDALMERGLV